MLLTVFYKFTKMTTSKVIKLKQGKNVMNILKITSKIVSVETKCFISFFSGTFTIGQKFSSAKGYTFSEVTFEGGSTFVSWD